MLQFKQKEDNRTAIGCIKGHIEIDNGYDASHFIYGSEGYFEFRSLPAQTTSAVLAALLNPRGDFLFFFMQSTK